MSSKQNTPSRPLSRHLWKFLPALPVFIAIALVLSQNAGGVDQTLRMPDGHRPNTHGRLIVVMVDSLRPQALSPSLMPNLYRLSKRSDALTLPLTTCVANFTLPCSLTMFEGRESPFMSGLHNWTGAEGGSTSLPALLKRLGTKVVMLSDHTLHTLYGNYTSEVVDISNWAPDPLDRDRREIEEAERYLKDPTIGVLVLHTVGTDKVAHLYHPKTAGYNHHYRAYDARLAQFLEKLDYQRDAVLIVGDHGHTDKGAHDPHAVAIFVGARFQELFASIEPLTALHQTDLLYFMSFAMNVPLSLAYEGRFFDARGPKPTAELQRFFELQRFVLAQAGFRQPKVQASFAAHRRSLAQARLLDLNRYAPLLLVYLAFIAFFLGREELTYSLADLPYVAGFGALAVAAGLLSTPVSAPYIAAAIFVAALALLLVKRSWRTGLVVLGIGLAAAVTGALAAQWSGYFHRFEGDFHLPMLVFYLSLPLLGALIGFGWLRSVKAAPEGAMLYTLLVLPSGVYYYQFGPNMFMGLLIAAVLLLTVLWRPLVDAGRERLTLFASTAAVLIIGGLLVIQEGSNWKWYHYVMRWLDRGGAPAALASYAALSAFILWRLPTALSRTATLAYLVAAPIYCVAFAELALSTFVVAHLPAAFFVAWHGSIWNRRFEGSQRSLLLGFVLFATAVASVWFMLHGFFLKNVDIAFALKAFKMRADWQTLLVTGIASLLKYGLPAFFTLTVAWKLMSRDEFEDVFTAFLAIGSLKTLALFAQVLAGMRFGVDKRYEFAISDLFFLSTLMLIATLCYGGLAVASWARERQTSKVRLGDHLEGRIQPQHLGVD